MKQPDLVGDFGQAGIDLTDHINTKCKELSKIIHDVIRHASRHSLQEVVMLCVQQGYLNGCFDTSLAETETKNAYLTKLRLLLHPVRILLEANVRQIEDQNSKKPDSSG